MHRPKFIHNHLNEYRLVRVYKYIFISVFRHDTDTVLSINNSQRTFNDAVLWLLTPACQQGKLHGALLSTEKLSLYYVFYKHQTSNNYERVTLGISNKMSFEIRLLTRKQKMARLVCV